MKNCEGSTGTHNRLLRGQGRSFQVIEAPLGVPSGAAQVIATGLALPEITVIVEFSWEILKIFFLTLSGDCGIPRAITSEKVIRHNRKAQGRFGGTGTVPSVNRCFTIC